MNDGTKAFLKSAYKEYYFRHSDWIEFPAAVQSREFGYMPFAGGMVRHLSFKDEGEALAELLKQSPSSVYCSNARYEHPARPIEEKGWLGAELIFDIDATDIPTQCKRTHDLWYCETCHASGRLPRQPKCPKCGSTTTDFHGTCRECLGAAKDHALRVLDFMTNDFGIASGSVRIYFSGNRGYHLHVDDARFEPLDSPARGEVAGYLRGDSLPPNQTIASTLRRRPPNSGPMGDGWTRRIVDYVDARMPDYTGTLRKLVSDGIAAQKALVDSSVTTDVHRVFRLAGTLHGDTGMAKMRVKSFDSFDPFSDPVVLSSKPVTVNVSFYPSFEARGERFGPYRSEPATLPTFAAVRILTRGMGEVA